METERAIAQASEPVREKWVKVQIYTPAHICTGYVYCPHQRRLLDVLNGMPMRKPSGNDEFLRVSEGEMRSPDRTVKSVHISKANTLFVKEIGDGQTQGLGGQGGHKPYPFVDKSVMAVRLHMSSYTLTGRMHYAQGEHVCDVLNSELRFLALTNVEICPSAGSTESGVSFIAVNKGQVVFLEELGVPVSGGARKKG